MDVVVLDALTLFNHQDFEFFYKVPNKGTLKVWKPIKSTCSDKFISFGFAIK